MPEFLEEGTVNGRLTVLPIAKSAEILYVNQTIFDRFAAATGAKIEDLSTWEGLYALAEQYAKWSDGKCFFVHDYHFNYFQVGVESKGRTSLTRMVWPLAPSSTMRGSLTRGPR